jgi:CheY-like chemotaxis protein
VLDVGQCSFDHGNISRMLSEACGAEVEAAATSDDALNAVRSGRYDLVLVNRVFDADGSSGLDLIERLQSDQQTRATPVMLVSNYADAQDQAEAAGARCGFGKDALSAPETRERLLSLLTRAAHGGE